MPKFNALKSLSKNSGKIDFIGKIRDPIHDTIPYTAQEKVIIDRPEFQRLRRIQQTAFIKYVFPGATHTRFEHSLGSMHIAGLLYGSLIDNQNRILASLEESYKIASLVSQQSLIEHEKEQGSLLQTRKGLKFLEQSPYLTQCLRFAALLHDCGHSALSHSGERFMPTWQQLSNKMPSLSLPEWLSQSLEKKIELASDKTTSIHHEVYTLLIIERLFKYDDEFLCKKMGQDICSILEPSILPHAESDLTKSGLQSLFHEVISGEIDVDRMDYLLRDSHQCGVVYGYFDLGRILDSIGFYFNQNTNQYHLALRRSGISAYEDYLRARLSMYNQVYFHKTATACEAMLEYFKENSPPFHFPLEIDDYMNIDDYSLLSVFNHHLVGEKEQLLKKLMKELLLERKLWKRVYEEVIPFQEIKFCKKTSYDILNFLREQSIPVSLIETLTNLTRFSPKMRGNSVKNTFKVIIKDVNSLVFLEPIDVHSNLINRVDEEFMLRRIFIAKQNDRNEEININFIQKKISERMIT